MQRRITHKKRVRALRRIKVSGAGAPSVRLQPGQFLRQLRIETAQAWKKFRYAISTAPIKLKAMVVIGAIVFSTLAVLSLMIYQSGKTIIMERLQDTCDVLVTNLNEYTKDAMVLETAEPGMSRYEIQEVVLRFRQLEIDGFQYALVVNREREIIAHSIYTNTGKELPEADSLIVSSLTESYWREVADTTTEFIQPIIAVRPEDADEAGEELTLGAAIIGFNTEELWRPVRQVRSALIGAVVLVTVLSAIIIYVVTRRMTAQISELSAGARLVGDGNLDVHIPVRRRDDLGRLVQDFNTMISQLRERLHMQKFVSKLTVDMIRKRAAMGDPPDKGGETRLVTILFSDIRNFSALTETLSPKEIVKLINIYLDLQANIIQKITVWLTSSSATR